MTDDKVRPASDQSREAETEPAVAGENGVPDTAAAEPDAPEAVESVEGETAVTAPAGATVERVDEPVERAAPETVDETPEAGPVERERPEAVGEAVEADPAESAVPEAVGESTESEPEKAGPAPIGPAGETVSEPGVDVPVGDQRSDTFIWHPDHGGKTADEVRQGLAQEIANDQRQHRLAMDGAEESEQDALASVVSLERKWGPYDFDWAEQDPEMLAARITEFELERERRHEMVSWSDYRDEAVDQHQGHEAGERPAELSTGIKAMSLLLVVLLIVIILLAVWAL